MLPNGELGEGSKIHGIRVGMKSGTEYLSTLVRIIANRMAQSISLLIGNAVT